MGTARAEQLRKRLAQGLAARPILRGALRALGAGCFCFVLAGAGLLSEHVPLALAPVCVLPFGPAAVCAYLGAAAGYAMFWGLSSALEPVAAGFLMLAGSCLFRELLPAQRRGFVPAAAGGIYALLGLIFVLQADGGMRAALLLALRLTLLVVSIRALCPAEENARLQPYAAAVCLLAGLVRVELPFGVPLAAVEAAAVCLLADSMEDALLIGAACGLVLDLGSVPSPPQTACFCLPLLVCRMANLRRTARAAAFAGLYFLCVLVWGGEHAGWTLGVLAGAVLSCLLPGFALPDTRRDAPAAASTLVQTADVLQQMETKLSLSCPQTQTAPALIFDSAADDVCRSCVKRQQCWQERADDTCRLLSACAGTIMRQGQANAGDLPAGFCAVCIREEAFRAAYKGLIDSIRSASPDTKIIVCSLLPVAENYTGADGLTNVAVAQVTTWLKQVCTEASVYYADISSALTLNGSLASEYSTGDGHALSSAGCSKVLEYLSTHAVG